MVQAYSGDVYRYAFWLCGSKEQAEDLTQEAFARAWKYLDKLESYEKAKPWLMTIVRNENARRFERYQPDTVDVDDVPIAIDPCQAPESQTEREQVMRAIMSLDESYREPLIMQMVGGFKGEEIAEALGIARPAVMTRLFRAKQKVLAAFSDNRVASENGHERPRVSKTGNRKPL